MVLDLPLKLKSIISSKKKKKNLSQCLIKHQVFDLNFRRLNWTKAYLRILDLKPQNKNYESA